MENNTPTLSSNDALSQERCPRSKCHLYLTLNSKEIDADTTYQFEIIFGCKLDPWGTEVAKSHFINSWDINDVISEFIFGIDKSSWKFLNDMIDRLGGDLLLSVETWFYRPPVFTIGKDILNKAVNYNFTMDFDLYPIGS